MCKLSVCFIKLAREIPEFKIVVFITEACPQHRLHINVVTLNIIK
jgi:hypothetical protein